MSFFSVNVPSITGAFCFLLTGHGRKGNMLVDQLLSTLFFTAIPFTVLSFPVLSLLFARTGLRVACSLGSTRVRIAKDPISMVSSFLTSGMASLRLDFFCLSLLRFCLFSFSSLSAFLLLLREGRTLASPLTFIFPLFYAGA